MKETPYILLVDDDVMFATTACAMLQNCGYERVWVANTVAEAYELLEQAKPHLVLMDIELNDEKDGIELAGELSFEHNLPIIFTTQHASKNVLERMIQVEPYSYLVKPYTQEQLQAALMVAELRLEIERESHRRESSSLRAFEVAAIAMAVISPDTRLLRINRAFRELFGEEPNDLMDMVHEDSRDTFRNLMDQILSGAQRHLRAELRYLVPDGIRWGMTTLSSAFDIAGRQKSLVVQIQDINRQKQMEEVVEDETLDLVDYSHRLREIHRLALEDFDDPEACLKSYLDIGCRLYGFNSGFIMHLNNGIIHRWAAETRPGGYCPAEFETLESFPGREALNTQKPVVLQEGSNLQAPTDTRPFTNYGLKAYVGIPLFIGDSFFGSLNFCDTARGNARVSNYDLELFELMAVAIAKATKAVTDPSLKA